MSSPAHSALSRVTEYTEPDVDNPIAEHTDPENVYGGPRSPPILMHFQTNGQRQRSSSPSRRHRNSSPRERRQRSRYRPYSPEDRRSARGYESRHIERPSRHSATRSHRRYHYVGGGGSRHHRQYSTRRPTYTVKRPYYQRRHRSDLATSAQPYVPVNPWAGQKAPPVPERYEGPIIVQSYPGARRYGGYHADPSSDEVPYPRHSHTIIPGPYDHRIRSRPVMVAPTIIPSQPQAFSRSRTRSRTRSRSRSRLTARSSSRGRSRSPRVPQVPIAPTRTPPSRSRSWPPSSKAQHDIHPHLPTFIPPPYAHGSVSMSRTRSRSTRQRSRSHTPSLHIPRIVTPTSPPIIPVFYRPSPSPSRYYSHGQIPFPTSTRKRPQTWSQKMKYNWVFVTDTAPRTLYLYALLRIPALYYSRVTRVFEDARLSLPDIKQMYITSDNDVVQHNWDVIPYATHDIPNYPTLSRFKRSWDEFVDSVTREWQVQNVVAVLLLSAVLTMLQIDSINNDPLSRTAAILSLICALMSLLYGCMYMTQFGSMKRLYKAASWAEESQNTRTLIFWNVWIMLSMPAVWLAWAMLLFVTCIMSFVWRTGSSLPDPSPLDPNQALWPRIAVTAMFGLGLVYLMLILKTLSRYGSNMDEEWKEKVKQWKAENCRSPKSRSRSPIVIYPSHGFSRSRSRSPIIIGHSGPYYSRSRSRSFSPASGFYPSGPHRHSPIIIHAPSPVSPSYRARSHSPVPVIIPHSRAYSRSRSRSFSPTRIPAHVPTPYASLPSQGYRRPRSRSGSSPRHNTVSAYVITPPTSPARGRYSPPPTVVVPQSQYPIDAPSGLRFQRESRPHSVVVINPPAPPPSHRGTGSHRALKRKVLIKPRRFSQSNVLEPPEEPSPASPSDQVMYIPQCFSSSETLSLDTKLFDAPLDQLNRSVVLSRMDEIGQTFERRSPYIVSPWLFRQDWERFLEDLRTVYFGPLPPTNEPLDHWMLSGYIRGLLQEWNIRYFSRFGIRAAIIAPGDIDIVYADTSSLTESSLILFSVRGNTIHLRLDGPPFSIDDILPPVPKYIEDLIPFSDITLAAGPYLTSLRRSPFHVPSSFGFPPHVSMDGDQAVLFVLPSQPSIHSPAQASITNLNYILQTTCQELRPLLTYALLGILPVEGMTALEKKEMRDLIFNDILFCWNRAFFHPRGSEIRVVTSRDDRQGSSLSDPELLYTVSIHRLFSTAVIQLPRDNPDAPTFLTTPDPSQAFVVHTGDERVVSTLREESKSIYSWMDPSN